MECITRTDESLEIKTKRPDTGVCVKQLKLTIMNEDKFIYNGKNIKSRVVNVFSKK